MLLTSLVAAPPAAASGLLLTFSLSLLLLLLLVADGAAAGTGRGGRRTAVPTAGPPPRPTAGSKRGRGAVAGANRRRKVSIDSQDSDGSLESPRSADDGGAEGLGGAGGAGGGFLEGSGSMSKADQRREWNKNNARKSRMRKKFMVDTMAERMHTLQSENNRLHGLIGKLGLAAAWAHEKPSLLQLPSTALPVPSLVPAVNSRVAEVYPGSFVRLTPLMISSGSSTSSGGSSPSLDGGIAPTTRSTGSAGSGGPGGGSDRHTGSGSGDQTGFSGSSGRHAAGSDSRSTGSEDSSSGGGSSRHTASVATVSAHSAHTYGSSMSSASVMHAHAAAAAAAAAHASSQSPPSRPPSAGSNGEHDRNNNSSSGSSSGSDDGHCETTVHAGPSAAADASAAPGSSVSASLPAHEQLQDEVVASAATVHVDRSDTGSAGGNIISSNTSGVAASLYARPVVYTTAAPFPSALAAGHDGLGFQRRDHLLVSVAAASSIPAAVGPGAAPASDDSHAAGASWDQHQGHMQQLDASSSGSAPAPLHTDAANAAADASNSASGGASPVPLPLEPADYELMELITITHQHFLITDPLAPDNPIVFASSGFFELTGYAPHEILGVNCRFLQGPDTDPATVRHIAQCVKEGRDCHAVIRNYRKDGSPFWNELFIAPLRNGQGKVVHFVGVQKAIDDRLATRMLGLQSKLQHTGASTATSAAAGGHAHPVTARPPPIELGTGSGSSAGSDTLDSPLSVASSTPSPLELISSTGRAAGQASSQGRLLTAQLTAALAGGHRAPAAHLVRC